MNCRYFNSLIWILLFFGSESIHCQEFNIVSNTKVPLIGQVIQNPDFTAQEIYDSIFKIPNWSWSEINQTEYEFLQKEFTLRAEASKSIEEKFGWYEKIKHNAQLRGLMGETVIFYEKLIGLANVLEDTMKLRSIYFDLAYFYNQNNMLDESLRWMRASLPLSRVLDDPQHFNYSAWWYGYYLSNYAWQTQNNALQDTAVLYLSYAYQSCINNDRPDGETIIIYSIALARADKRPRAIEVAKYGLSISEEVGDFLYQERFARQLGDYYTSLDYQDSALFYYYKAADTDLKLHPDGAGMIDIEYEGKMVHMFNVYALLGCNSHFKRYKENVTLMDNTLAICDQMDPDLQAEYYHMGNIYYEEAGEYLKAAKCGLKYAHLSDSLNWVEKNKYIEAHKAHSEAQITLSKEQSEFEKKQLELINNQEKEQQEFVIKGFIIGAIFLVLFLAFMYSRYRLTKNQKRIIEKQKNLVDQSYKDLDKKNKEILDSINYAKRIQSAILPPQEQIDKALKNAFILYLPKDIVAGDFYWIEERNETVFFAAADCTGHGVPGAMVSVICNNGLNRAVREHKLTDPGEILDKTRDIVVSEFEKSQEEVYDGMDIALCSLKGNVLSYAGANNALLILRKGAKEFEEYKADKQPIGKYYNAKEFTTHFLEVNEGDSIYLFTDGFLDQFGGDETLKKESGGKKISSKRFKDLILANKHLNMADQQKVLHDFFLSWKGNREQIDDVCVIGVRI